jgi:hypothetical protein
MRAVLLLAATAHATKSTWQHTNAFDRDLQDPKTRALLERRDRRDRNRDLVEAVALVHTLRSRTRYFTLLEVDGDVWLTARGGNRADSCKSAPCDQLLWRNGSHDRLITSLHPHRFVSRDGVAHNLAVAVDDDQLVAAGGLYRSRDPALYKNVQPLHGSDRYEGVEVFDISRDLTWTRTAVIDGRHPGCVERRAGFGGLCEFDGRLSLAPLGNELLLYARANTREAGGGRGVQVSRRSSEGWSPFERVSFEGLHEDDQVYFAAINRHPAFVLRHRGHQYAADALIALAPVSRADGSAYVGLAVSCDGVHFSNLEPLLNCTGGASLGRAPDHPVDGLLRRGATTHIYVHRDVPGIALHKAGRQPRPRIVRLDIPSWKLSDLAREKFRTLEGCDRVCRDARGRPEYC